MADIVERLQSHMYKADMSEVLADCRIAADEIEALRARCEKAEADLTSVAARYHRLHSICERILWTDLGVPAMANPKTQAVMLELSELIFTDAMIKASAVASFRKRSETDGE